MKATPNTRHSFRLLEPSKAMFWTRWRVHKAVQNQTRTSSEGEKALAVWILPNNYPQSSRYAQDMVASSEDLALPDLNIEQSLMWRQKPSQLRTWSQRWKRDSWFQHLCGRILKPCQWTAFESELTSSLAVIPASHSAQQDSAKAQKTPDTSGHSLGDTSRQLDLFAASSRTSKGTSALDSEKSLKTWKALVTKRRGEYLARLKSARLISASGSISWLTPVVQDSKHSGINPSANGSRGLLVNQVQWPTPSASQGGEGQFIYDLITKDGKPAMLGERAYNRETGDTLPDHAKQSSETLAYSKSKRVTRAWGHSTAKSHNHMLEKKYLNATVQQVEQTTGSLNPTWVEWLMGLPLGWTDLDSWATE